MVRHSTQAQSLEQSLKREGGISLLTTAIFGSILGAAVYVAYHVLPFYYDFYELKGHFEQSIKIASTETDEEIRRRLMYHIKKFGIPCDPEDLKIERDGDTMKIRLKYREIFSIPWDAKLYDIKFFDFDARASGKYR